ncbi:ROK family transcriptional regulator [Pseudonocardia halophobica]|uniref:Sugar kinase n=1 Tax=Pseudonocardia halophobica TaxID=29401 RepID=A0A9W6KXU0_9PSEU|nr:ROK family protein [Pseudonocardia halophobica]GLL09653.1 sugar kinase [Pseudonocardia halophobica]
MQLVPSAQDVLVLAQLVDLVRTGRATTRPDLEAATGLGRKVVTQRIKDGLDLGVLAEGDLAPSQGGRAPRTVRFRAEAGLILAACLGASECDAALTTLDGQVLGSLHLEVDIADGPASVLERVDTLFTELLDRHGRGRDLWGVGVGVPGPVDFTTGRIVAPPIMPGWDDFDVRAWFRNRYDAPIWVDNDVNLMALAEWHRGTPREGRDLLYVKVGTGIGSGLVSGGRLHRGDTGAAGDIGHVRVTDDESVVCRCGRTGCLEAAAGGWALARDLTRSARAGASPFLAERLAERGRLAPEHIGQAVASGDPVARAAIVGAARTVGGAVANIVNFANPGAVVLGGGVLRTGDEFFRIFADTVRTRAVELATRRLAVRTSSLDFTEGVTGAALLAVERLFRRDALPLWIAHGSPAGSAIRLQNASVA